MKTRKTLIKRIKITKNGKIVKKQNSTGHLKAKWSAGRKSRKRQRLNQTNKGHRRQFKKMLGKAGGRIK